jgi:hypothetical protein
MQLVPLQYGGRRFDPLSPARGGGGGGGTILSSLFGTTASAAAAVAAATARSPPEPLLEQWPWLEPLLRLAGAPVLDVVGAGAGCAAAVASAKPVAPGASLRTAADSGGLPLAYNRPLLQASSQLF